MMPTPTLCGLVIGHGGIMEIRTHAVRGHFNRATGAYDRRAWANTIRCKDGWTRTLSTADEQELRTLPEPMKAERHVVED